MIKSTPLMLLVAWVLLPILAEKIDGPHLIEKPETRNETLKGVLQDEEIPTCTTQLTGMQLRSGQSDERYRWRNGFVYHPDRAFTQSELQVINEAMYELSTFLCIPVLVWPQNSNPTGDYVEIVRGGVNSGCWSQVGRQGGRQDLNLQTPGCVHKPTVMHEAIHALGFFHEQSRPDRDSHVNIFLNNVEPGKEHNFAKADGTLTFGVAYDKRSIMHYGSTAFSKNGQPTILGKDGSQVGGGSGLTSTDIAKLKRMYNCQEGGSWATFYEHINHQGQTLDIRSNGECVNMPGTFNDKASSIDTHNTCMRVFEHGNCQGRSFDYRPGNGYHFNMGQDGFNDVVSSVIAC